jgi:hypothetical protein
VNLQKSVFFNCRNASAAAFDKVEATRMTVVLLIKSYRISRIKKGKKINATNKRKAKRGIALSKGI